MGGGKDSFKVDTFQSYDPKLGERLLEVLSTKHEQKKILICLPHQLRNSSISKTYSALFWDREWLARQDFLAKYCLDKPYGDTNFTRFYMGRKDISDYEAYIASLKQIWRDRDLLIVEGELSRLGVGNELFDTAHSIQRIICPKTNAFMYYDAIFAEVLKHSKAGTLIILALGHTATLLAYDLSERGHQALDLGHIDVEYEWFRMGANRKVAIPNKYVNEVHEGRIEATSEVDEGYQREIIAKIL